VRRSDEEMADEILFSRAHADASLAAAALRTVGRDRGPLDVARVGDGDRHVLVGDQVLDAELTALVDDLGPAPVGELVADALQLGHDQLNEQLLAGQDRAEALDRLHQLDELVEDLLAFQPRQPLELHVEDGLRLGLRELEVRLEPLARLRRALRSANQLDHFVEVVERDPEAFEDVGARLGLPELELGPPADDLAAELDEVLDDLEEAQDLRPAAGDRQHDDPERRLELGVLVEIVEHDFRHFAALQLDHDPHAVAVRLVAQVRDALDRLVAVQLRDVLDQALLVDLVRNLGHDERRLVALPRFFGRHARAHRDGAAARRVGLYDARAPDDDAA